MDASQKTILVIGGAGFIGTHTVVKELVVPELSKKLQLNLGDSRNRDDLVKLFSKTKNEKGDSINASYYHIVNPSSNTIVAAEVTYSFFTNVNTITVGTQHVLDSLTTIKDTGEQCWQRKHTHPT
ncbi:hypothetical protein ERO13_D11G222200v2 [Gossypium hirsutum]|uniref:NAD(P)-binding domain-containing protein n=3 Tax=Gossypium TaxID=3633 RepID=A0A5J5PES4_GOSBA|nr:mitochondrial outer membrane protein porin of 36 kDa isoform X3 [Gossypium hirsutum]KAB2004967.1 hypothetical protein ES319_D11G237300v1 [Gossypium barbadense]TYG46359.1 hypothetical protein ES288_D11G250800v1 [Gossypium darwinii]KAB2004969.1 hypothetical protein ES319_D11G237300v1 [Gossypium barbadense]KAB2004970.1 hypothetical protein ES319_D11G237300v1 [Gossypium barbadense]KAG4121673.1 hypothetical protein ERO13_D11G222200v2 [Gossypium hirsutum]